MPHTASQTFLRELFLRSGDIPVAGGGMMATGMSPLPRSHPADRPKRRMNPPFNTKEWWDGKLEGDARWSRSEAESASHAQFYQNRDKYGTPPQTAMRECAALKSEGTPQVVSEARHNRVALPAQFVAEFDRHFVASAKLETAIRANLKTLNFKP